MMKGSENKNNWLETSVKSTQLLHKKYTIFTQKIHNFADLIGSSSTNINSLQLIRTASCVCVVLKPSVIKYRWKISVKLSAGLYFIFISKKTEIHFLDCIFSPVENDKQFSYLYMYFNIGM